MPQACNNLGNSISTPTEVTAARLALTAFQATAARSLRSPQGLGRPSCFQHAEDPVCADSRSEMLERVTTDESTEGEHLGSLDTGVATANCAFGDDGTVLYIAADTNLCRIKLTTNRRSSLRATSPGRSRRACSTRDKSGSQWFAKRAAWSLRSSRSAGGGSAPFVHRRRKARLPSARLVPWTRRSVFGFAACTAGEQDGYSAQKQQKQPAVKFDRLRSHKISESNQNHIAFHDLALLPVGQNVGDAAVGFGGENPDFGHQLARTVH